MHDLLIHNCHVLLVTASGPPEVRRNQDILIDGNGITAIQPTVAIDQVEARAIVEANQQLALPGLINTHAHVPMMLFRGLAEDVAIERWFNEFMWPLESNLTAEDVYWGMLLGLVEMIESGVTTVADHYFFMDEAAQAVQEAGTRAALGWAVFGDRGRAALDATADFVQRWQGGADGRITTWMAPHAPYTCDDTFLRHAVAHAQRLGTGIHIHAAEEIGQTQASLAKRGITPIQVLEQTGILDGPTIIAHGCGILPQDVELLARYRDHVGVTHSPKTYLKLGMGLTPIAALRAVGVPVGLGTDGAVSNNTLDILESLRLMAMLQKHEARNPEIMPIAEALDIAFQGSAAVVGLANKIGQLAPGYLADIILVDLSGAHHQPLHSVTASLVYNTRAGDVQTVIVNGRVLMQDRTLLTLDKVEIIKQVNKGMARLAQRVPAKRIQVYNP
ncbi:MAG: amidohydrolase [Chloroflexota bacterium]|nr:amidohydrolase [Chloroflexota bacterium]